jgi:hypothetical protein
MVVDILLRPAPLNDAMSSTVLTAFMLGLSSIAAPSLVVAISYSIVIVASKWRRASLTLMVMSDLVVLVTLASPAASACYSLSPEMSFVSLLKGDTIGEFSTDDDGCWWWNGRQSPRVVINRSDRHFAELVVLKALYASSNPA